MNSSSPRIFWPTVTVILKRLMVGSILELYWVGLEMCLDQLYIGLEIGLGQYWSYIGLGWECAWIIILLGCRKSLTEWIWTIRTSPPDSGPELQSCPKYFTTCPLLSHRLWTTSPFGLQSANCDIVKRADTLHSVQCTALWQDNDQSAYRSNESFCESSVVQNFIRTKQEVTSSGN